MSNKTTAADAVEPMLVLSTGNLTQATCDALCAGQLDEIVIPRPDVGAIVYVPETDDGQAPPADLLAAFTLARRLGCCWIMFDRDAAEHADLEAWVW